MAQVRLYRTTVAGFQLTFCNGFRLYNLPALRLLFHFYSQHHCFQDLSWAGAAGPARIWAARPSPSNFLVMDRGPAWPITVQRFTAQPGPAAQNV